MSPARLGAFAQRIARTIVQREVAIAHEGDDFRHMKVLVLAVSASGFWSLTPPPPALFYSLSSARTWDPSQEALTPYSQRARQRKCGTFCVRVLREGASRPLLFIHLFHSAFYA